jgi:stage II sporulation protein D
MDEPPTIPGARQPARRPARRRAALRGSLLAVLAGMAVAATSPALAAVRGAPGDPAPSDGDVTVTGSGFGHGVGMSQYGALGMARDGESARAILTHYYSGTTVASHSDDVDLSVNVVDRGTSVTLSADALADGGGVLRLITGGGQAIDLPAGSSAVVTIEGSTLKVVTTPASGDGRTFTTSALTVRWSGGRNFAGPASVLKLTSRSANAASTSSKARSYRWGALRFVPVDRADSDNVTRTRIEGILVLNLHSEYLRGLAEVPSSWPAAALQAQVVAARNYALTEYQGGSDPLCGGCELWDDTRSQVYRGWGTESVAPRWVQAVAATQTSSTSGLAVLYEGAPIRAYYSSSSGGRTRDAESAWGKAVPYLVSVDDKWSVDPSVNPGYARWQRSVPLAKVASAFGLADVTSVKVTARDRSGAAVTVTATASDGTTANLPGTTVKSKLGLPAPWLTSFEIGRGAGAG